MDFVQAVAGCLALAVAACGGVVTSDPPSLPASASATGATQEPSVATPEPDPPYNRVEARVAEALLDIGMTPERVEYSPSNRAFMAAQFENGSYTFLSAERNIVDRGNDPVLSERTIDGVSVQRISFATGIRYRFQCGATTYEAAGVTPPGFSSFYDYVAALIESLGCGPK